MKGIKFQLRSLILDKLCIITFILPILVAVGINLISNNSFSSISDTLFYVVEDELSIETLDWLEDNGTLISYSNEENLISAVNDPTTQGIGVRINGDSIKTIISGDEYSVYKKITENLPTLYENREMINDVNIDIIKSNAAGNEIKNLLIAITILTAVFMSLTYSAMNIISEKEDGVAFINEILPLSKKDYILQKISLGFIGGILSSCITTLICGRLAFTNLILLFILITISTFIASIIGVYLGKKIENLMIGITAIKFLMILFIAPPILFYLTTSSNSLFRLVSFILPSSALFYGITDIMSGETGNVLLYASVLLLHSIFCISLIYRKKGNFR